MKRVTAMLLAMMLGAGSAVADTCGTFRDLGNDALISDPASWGAVNAHDPALIRDGDKWYVFSTDASIGDVHRCGLQVRSSGDLIHWQYDGIAFEDYTAACETEIQAAGLDPSKHQGLWAPDLIKVGDQWRMYYSASTFGSTRSAIGLAVAERPEGPWEDQGIVIRSDANAVSKPNAIDPCPFAAPDGKQYLTWGSFFGGIYLTELDESGFATGEPVRIAGFRGCRAEGSYLIYLPQTEYYYLFVSYGSLSDDYNIRVGRSRIIEGPFLDANDRQMTDLVAANESRIGVKLMGGYQLQHDPGSGFSKGIKAPGHCSVAVDGEWMWLCHHARTQTLPTYWFGMQIRPMVLSEDGWPMVMPMSYQGEPLEGAASLPEGGYNLIEHGTDSNKEPVRSRRVTLKDGKMDTGDTCALKEGGRVELTVEGEEYSGFAMWQRDDERNGWVMSITAISRDGRCVWLSEETLHNERE